jgi:opacity protein-like surface antigen
VLEAEKKEGEWYAVRVDLDTGGTVIGYVHESLVRVVAGAPAQAKPAPSAAKEPPPEAAKAQPAEPGETAKPPAAAAQVTEPSTKPPPASQTPKQKAADLASISLWFGGRYAMVGDLNEGAAGMADFFSSQLGADTTNDVDSVHIGSTFGVEYRHPLSKALDVAVAAGYFSAKNSSTLNFEDLPTTTRYMTTPSVRAIPVSLSLVFFPESLIYVKAGVELAFAHCEYLYRFEEGGKSREWQGEADGIDLGFAMGAGAQLRITGPVSVFAEADYRKLQVGSLDGREVYRESGKADVTTEGTLYYGRSTVPSGSTVTGVFILQDFPGGAGVVEARKAELSLSGLSLHAGLKIAF